MERARCPYCFVTLTLQFYRAGAVVRCASCYGPLRVPEARPFQRLNGILGGVALGAVLGMLVTLTIFWSLRTPLPPLQTASVRTPTEPAPAPSETPTPPADVELSWESRAIPAIAQLNREFAPRNFLPLRARPWLLFLEEGPYDSNELLQLCARALDSLWTTFARDFDSLHLQPPNRPLTVIIFRDRDSFDGYCRLSRGAAMPPIVTGSYEPALGRTITYYDGRLPFDRLLHEALHQLVHQFSTGPMESLWFHEGLGTLYEVHTVTGPPSFREVRVVPAVNPQRLYIALKALRDRDLKSRVDLRHLLNLSIREFNRWFSRQKETVERDQHADAYYAVSWGLVHFLLRSDPVYRAVLQEYFVEETRGRAGRGTFERILRERTGLDLDQFQIRFKEYLFTLR